MTEHNPEKGTNDTIVSNDSSPESSQNATLSGLRLTLVMAGICLAFFLITVEITIVNTALVTIAKSLLSFDRSSWVITSYLLTYVGFLIIFSKLSDILGRKLVLIFSLSWFILWASLCGAAQTTTQLIIFRAFQGIGAAGGYSSIMIIIFELYPAPKIPLVAAGVLILTTCSVVLGPVLGGLINQSNYWRWIFLFNAPAGIIAVIRDENIRYMTRILSYIPDTYIIPYKLDTGYEY